jgi:hypothetical protein
MQRALDVLGEVRAIAAPSEPFLLNAPRVSTGVRLRGQCYRNPGTRDRIRLNRG